MPYLVYSEDFDTIDGKEKWVGEQGQALIYEELRTIEYSCNAAIREITKALTLIERVQDHRTYFMRTMDELEEAHDACLEAIHYVEQENDDILEDYPLTMEDLHTGF